MAAGSRDWEFWGVPADSNAEPCNSNIEDDAPDDGDFNYDTVDEATAAEFFEELLIDLKLSGKLQASHVCILAYWAVKGGLRASETLRRLATKPTVQSGQFSNKFDKACE
jgi:hypothetical protein